MSKQPGGDFGNPHEKEQPDSKLNSMDTAAPATPRQYSALQPLVHDHTTPRMLIGQDAGVRSTHSSHSDNLQNSAQPSSIAGNLNSYPASTKALVSQTPHNRAVSAMFTSLPSFGTSVKRAQPLLPALAAASAAAAASKEATAGQSSLVANASAVSLPKPEISALLQPGHNTNGGGNETRNQSGYNMDKDVHHPSPGRFWMSFTPLVGNQSKALPGTVNNRPMKLSANEPSRTTARPAENTNGKSDDAKSTSTLAKNESQRTNVSGGMNNHSSSSGTSATQENQHRAQLSASTPIKYRAAHYFTPKVLSPGRPLAISQSQSIGFETAASSTAQSMGNNNNSSAIRIESTLASTENGKGARVAIQTNLPLPSIPAPAINSSLVNSVSMLSPSSPGMIAMKAQFGGGSTGRSPVRRALIPVSIESPAYSLMRSPGTAGISGPRFVVPIGQKPLTHAHTHTHTHIHDHDHQPAFDNEHGGLAGNGRGMSDDSHVSGKAPSSGNLTPPPSARRLQMSSSQPSITTPDFPSQSSSRNSLASPTKWSSSENSHFCATPGHRHGHSHTHTRDSSHIYPQFESNQMQISTPNFIKVKSGTTAPSEDAVTVVSGDLSSSTDSGLDLAIASLGSAAVSTSTSVAGSQFGSFSEEVDETNEGFVPSSSRLGANASVESTADVGAAKAVSSALDLGGRQKTVPSKSQPEVPLRSRYATRYGASSAHLMRSNGAYVGDQDLDDLDSTSTQIPNSSTTQLGSSSLPTRTTRSQLTHRDHANASSSSHSDSGGGQSKSHQDADRADTSTQNQAQNVTAHIPGQHKPCNCKKSRCLKLYCECFARRGYCIGCNCSCCQNTPEFSDVREKAIKQILDRDPNAFFRSDNRGLVQGDEGDAGEDPSLMSMAAAIANPASCTDINIGDPQAAIQAVGSKHMKGCNCKKSGCQKKYCECFQAGVQCGPHCKCTGCKNCQDGAGVSASSSKKVPHVTQSLEKMHTGGKRIQASISAEAEDDDDEDDEMSVLEQQEQSGIEESDAEIDETTPVESEAIDMELTQKRALEAQKEYIFQHQQQLARAANSGDFIPGAHYDEEDDLLEPGVHISKPQASFSLAGSHCVLGQVSGMSTMIADTDNDSENRPVTSPTSSDSGAACATTQRSHSVSAGGAPMVPAADPDASETDAPVGRRRTTRASLALPNSFDEGRHRDSHKEEDSVKGYSASTSGRSATSHDSNNKNASRFPSLVSKAKDIDLLGVSIAHKNETRTRSQRLASRREEPDPPATDSEAMVSESPSVQSSHKGMQSPSHDQKEDEVGFNGRQRVTRRVTRLTRATGGEPALPDSSSSSSSTSATSSPALTRKRGVSSSSKVQSPTAKKVCVNSNTSTNSAVNPPVLRTSMRTRAASSVSTN